MPFRRGWSPQLPPLRDFVISAGFGGVLVLLAAAMLANSRPELREKLRQFRAEQSRKVLRETLP